MTTTITQFTDVVNGGASVSEGIGGTASAGDWLQVTLVAEGGAYASGATPSDDIGGSTGWVKVSEYDATGAGGSPDTFRQDWVKEAQGGETTVMVTWPGSVTQGSILGFWAHTLTQPDLYVIAEGIIPNGGFTATFVTPPGAVLTNNETYVGVMTAGGFVNSAQFTNICNTSGNGQNGNATVIGHYCDDEAAHSTADQPTYQMFTGRDGLYFVLYGFYTASHENDLAGVGTLGLGGTGELFEEHVDLAGVGTLGLGGIGALDHETDSLAGDGTLGLGGLGDLSVTGGELDLAGDGTLGLGQRGLLTAPDPYPPVPPIPAMTGQLDCGIYDAFIFTRGLESIVGRLPFNVLNWSRVLDDTSAAELTVNGVSNTGTLRDCCALLGSIMPWEHELAIYRNGLRVWSGPVTKVSYPSETVIIDALDLSGWLQIRNLHENHNDVQQDLASIWVGYVDDAMSVDNSAGLFPTVQALTGVLADRLFTEDMHTFASDAISELARTGLDWYCVDRKMVGGPVSEQPPAYPDAQPIPTLIDASFNPAPTVDRDGTLMGNCIYSNAMGSGPGGNAIFGEYGPHFPATSDHIEQAAAPDYAAIEERFGRIERVFQETKILDQPSADQNAATRYDLLKLPVDVISSGQLLPTAGIDMRQLLPGSIQNIHLSRACVQIGAPYRLKQLNVTANGDGSESVEGAWEPVGSIAAHEDLG